jgi:ATP-dependent helicase IRC3
MKLRPYQTEALAAIREAHARGENRLLVSAATGIGKTVIFAALAADYAQRGRVLILTHTDELCLQTMEKVAHWNPSLSIQLEKAEKHADDSAHIIIGSVQTLGRKGSSRLTALKPEAFSLIVTDEAHHSLADSYRRIYSHFGLMVPGASILHVGVTATPTRSDRQSLSAIFDRVVFELPIQQAIRDGWLADLKAYRIKTDTGLDGVSTIAGDFAQDELAAAVNTPRRNRAIIREWAKLAHDRKTMVFAVDVKHARDLAQEFTAQGFNAAAVCGEDEDRHERIAAHRSGDTQILVNAQLLREGHDDAEIACVVLARPTKSQLVYAQQIGRGTRLPDGVGNLHAARSAGITVAKEDCIIIDCGDNTTRHSLATVGAMFGLGAINLEGRSPIAVRRELDEAQLAHPGLDFSRIQNASDIKTIVDRPDLWAIKWSPVVLKASELRWRELPGEMLALWLPTAQREVVMIQPNALGAWSVAGSIEGKPITKSDCRSLEEAIRWADRRVRETIPHQLHLVKRVAPWHKDRASEAQLAYLRRLRIPIPQGLTKGGAADLISAHKEQRAYKAITNQQHAEPTKQLTLGGMCQIIKA